VSAAPLSPLSATRLVAARELRERTRSRSFLGGTAVLALLAAVAVLLPRVLPGFEQEWTVGLAPAVPVELAQVAQARAEAQGVQLEVVRLDAAPAGAAGDAAPGGAAGDAAVDELVAGDELDAVVLDARRAVVDAQAPGGLTPFLAGTLEQTRLLRLLAEAGADLATLEAEAAAVEVRTAGDAPEDRGGRELLAFLTVLALFISIASYGSWVLTSVLEEKANRVVEILVSAIAPRQLLAGKVIGNGLAGLAQFSVVVAVAAAVAVAAGSLPDLPPGTAVVVPALLGWFVLGFAFYAVLYAAAGSLVSRQEDAGSVSTPMIGLVMAGYFVALFVVLPDPGGTPARVLSFVPPLTPLVMPARTASGAADTWEVAAAAGLLLLATWLVVLLAGRVYSGALLRTGARVPLRDALGSARGRPAAGPDRRPPGRPPRRAAH
jgi:ABC-2 type transport system permease protein